MNHDCSRFDQFPSQRGGRELPSAREAWRRHLEECPSCRAQGAVARKLDEAMDELPVPRLSAGFHERLQETLDRRSRPPRRLALRRAVLHVYWLAAAVASFIIFTRLEWFASEGGFLLPAPWLLTLALVSVLFGAPFWALKRRFKIDLAELILDSLTP